MISKSTIEKVMAAADLELVIGKYTAISKKGANFSGSCPFHDEKTASFSYSPAKQVYKCFGCGKSGTNGVRFIMDKEGMSFPEAVEFLAGMFEVVVEYDGEYDPKALQEKRNKEKEQAELLKLADAWYHKKLMDAPRESEVWQKIYARGYDEEIVQLWGLGWAPQSNDNLKTTIINKGLWQPAVDIGLIKSSGGVSYDVYQDRIIIPIRNQWEKLIGFGGRLIPDNKDMAKFLNPPESEVYHKSEVLYGLDKAAAAIRHMGYAYLVEGYMDVISWHRLQVSNTVAPCGTALTEQQAKLLKRYTDKAVVVGDGDKAGLKAMNAQIDLLLKFDFRVEIVELPEGEDPDSLARTHKIEIHETESAAA